MYNTTAGSTGQSLYLTVPIAVPGLAAPVLAAHLGITEKGALNRLSAGPGLIASGLGQQSAQQLFNLLSVLGLHLRVVPDSREMRRFDLSIQLSIWGDLNRTAERIAGLFSRDPMDVAKELTLPGGVLLPDLDAQAAQRIQDRLAVIPGVIVLCADRDAAQYDVFATRALSVDQRGRLAKSLRCIGARPDDLTGACAADLGVASRDHLISRFPDFGLLALERSVKRFDLYLTGVVGWVTKDLADFLVARTGHPRARFEVITPDDPVLIDRGLTHSVMRQFCGDYAAIGLFTRPLLRGLARFPDNAIL
jgi:hypothetical protein